MPISIKQVEFRFCTIFVVVCLLAGTSVLLLTLAGCTNEAAPMAPPLIPPPLMEFSTTTIRRGDLVEVEARSGVTRYLSQPLSFSHPVAGFGQFHVSPGEFVTEGQLLLTLDVRELDEQIAAQEERIANMRRDHQLATGIRQIDIDMMILENAAPTNIDRAQMELRQLQARNALQLNHAEMRLKDAQFRRRAAELHAPFDGQITNIVDIALGDHVAIGRPLIYLTDGSTVIVEAINKPFLIDWPQPAPPPDDALPPDPWRPNTVRFAVKIQAHLSNQVWDLQYIPVPFEERPFRPVRFNVLSDTPIAVGQYVEVYFYRRFMEGVLLLPENALFSPLSQPYVYRVIDGELVFTEVSITERTPILGNLPLMVAVVEGLEEGDVVFVR